jgi:uncharacterized protein Yka (UPF0111/DUF47 family)
MRPHWFLPETPDVVGHLRSEAAATIAGMDAFAAWAGGDAKSAQALRQARGECELARRKVLNALRAAFVTPLEPEDAFALSRSIDRILGYALDMVGESEVMASPPDPGIAEMARLLSEAVRHIDDAIARLRSDPDAASDAADAALDAERRVAHAYYRGMAALLELESTRERISRRELYRRCARIGEVVVDVAERIQYAIVKQN